VQWLGHHADLLSGTETPDTWDQLNGRLDGDFRVTVVGGQKGTLTNVHLYGGREGTSRWDTIPGNIVWALGVSAPGSDTLMNAPDSSVAIRYNGKKLVVDVHPSDDPYVWPLLEPGDHITVEATITGAKGSTSTTTASVTLPNPLG
jgi:hypothetical protein